MTPVTQEEFEEMINAALDTIPEEFARHMNNLVVLARDYNQQCGVVLVIVPVSYTHLTLPTN